jgi:ketosteroid isomerase-like protein
VTTPANLNLVRTIVSDWERGDFGSAEWAHPEIEFVVPGEGPASGTYTGLAAIADGMRDLLDAWEEVRLEVEHYRELDGERVLVLGRFTGRGKTSGVDLGKIRPPSALLFQLADGKAVRVVYYTHREEVVADLGVAPEGDASEPGSQ